MKTAGWILIIIWNCNDPNPGILYTSGKESNNVGPVQVNKTANKWIGWPVYTAGIPAVASFWWSQVRQIII